jgi:ribonuclease J
MAQTREDFLTITPLGGLGEIGLNCQLWETPQGVVMVDCGLMFPDDSHLGVDVVIPSLDCVLAVRERFLGVVLTHGHEDHIGALPWLIPHLKGVRVYGSAFTLALVEHKLKERGLQDHAVLTPVTADTVLTLGDLRFRFFPVCHSIPEGFALGVESPVGAILHSGDFKIDPEPLFGSGTDMRLFEKFAGTRGVRLLLSDSTNAEREGHTLSEREVREELGKVFTAAPGRIVITLFSSHIHRIQEVFDLADQYGRSVVISGKSLANNIEKARELGLLHVPSAFFNAYTAVPDLPDEKLVLLVTGAQGEPLSALARMVQGEHRRLAIKRGDTVVMSSRMIPGNARAITRLINDMYRLGAEVHHEKVRDIHASGHAYREELRAMIEAVHPGLFVPIHGEYRHLVMHSRLAAECGVPPECAIILEDGEPLTLLPAGIRREERVPVQYTLVDGKGVGDVGTLVLKERHILGDEGMVLVVLVRDVDSGDILHGPQMISKGFVFHQQFEYLLEDAKCLVLDQLEENRNASPEKLGESVRASLRRFFRRVLDRDPVIVPVITDV